MFHVEQLNFYGVAVGSAPVTAPNIKVVIARPTDIAITPMIQNNTAPATPPRW